MTTKNLIFAFTAATLISACGGGSSSGISESEVSIGFSDFPVEGAEKVVVTVDSLSFVGTDETVVVDTFTSDDLDLADADTFQFDLLDVQGNDFKLVLCCPLGNILSYA